MFFFKEISYDMAGNDRYFMYYDTFFILIGLYKSQ